jgi:hypothetical protein
MCELLKQLKQFRDRLYHVFPRRADATMNLLDALASDSQARSAAELTLGPAFPRRYPSLYDAVDAVAGLPGDPAAAGERCGLEPAARRVVAGLLPAPSARPFWLFALDGVSLSRPHAVTLSDRSFVHRADPACGKMPVTIGHAYSLLVNLPEAGSMADPPWAVPLSSRRAPSGRGPLVVGAEQVKDLASDPELPWHGQLVVVVLDSAYSVVPFLGPVSEAPKVVAISRLRSNRVLYRLPGPRPAGQRGAPRVYGEPFKLGDATTRPAPDEVWSFDDCSRGGRTFGVRICVWHNLIMRGGAKNPGPLTVMQVVCTDAEGKMLYRRPLWLAVSGAHRAEIAAPEAYDAFRQRFDQEHFHRFARQRLLLGAFQTPDTAREVAWVFLACLAYAQLFAARHIARRWPRPWERYAKLPAGAVASPTTVQRDFGRIMGQLGTPASPPQPRGKAPGRAKGMPRAARKRHKVVRKSRKVG